MVKRYGVPYQGSKNKLAEWVVGNLPKGEVLVDLFAGGCAITHCAMELGKWNNFIANDLTDTPQFFLNCIKGKYSNEKRWISREEFDRLKDIDPYISICWSFGNNRTDYLYSKEIEPWKKALHFARVFGDFSKLAEFGVHSDGTTKDIKAHREEYKEKYIKWCLSKQKYTPKELDKLMQNVKADIKKDKEELRKYLRDALNKSGLTQAEVQRRLGTQMAGHYFGRSQWKFPTREMYEQMQNFMPLPNSYDELVGLYRLRQSLERLQSLQSLESLQSLQSLESLERLQRLQSLERLQSLQSLEIYQKDYKDLKIPQGAIVYADPPYRNTSTKGYKTSKAFNWEEFDRWLNAAPFPVIVSEYTAPSGCVEVATKDHSSTLGYGNQKKTTECLFIQKRYANWYKEQMKEKKIKTRPEQLSMFNGKKEHTFVYTEGLYGKTIERNRQERI